MKPEGPILLVEDDSNDIAIALRALSRAGLASQTVVARDGAEALELLDPALREGGAPLRPRVVFLDLKMPRMDGWDVLGALRALPDAVDIPIVVVSSSERDDDIRRCYALGANGFLVKRFDEREPGAYLVEAARYWLDLNRTPRALKEKPWSR
jgi:two-component system response regulator